MRRLRQGNRDGRAAVPRRACRRRPLDGRARRRGGRPRVWSSRGARLPARGRDHTVIDEPPRPAEFARQALATLDASEGRRRRRKRDTTPDKIGLDLKRELLVKTADADPPPDGYEAWLLGRVLAVPASGPV